MAGRKAIGIGVAALTALAASVAFAQPQRLMGGQWSGEYTCSQGLTGMTVELRPQRGDEVDATVIFFAHPRNPGVASGCYAARGTIDRASGRVVLRPTRWIVKPGESWSMTMLDGRVDAEGGYNGRVVFAGNPGACAAFALRRNARPFKPAPAQCVTQALMS
jgi:hypothetical protein